MTVGFPSSFNLFGLAESRPNALQHKRWCQHVHNFLSHIIICTYDWVGGPGMKIFGSQSGRTDWEHQGLCILTESQIFSRPDRPHSDNKHFIIWPFFFFRKHSVATKLFHIVFDGPHALLVQPYAFFRTYHLDALIQELFSYGFPRKLCTGLYGSYDKWMSDNMKAGSSYSWYLKKRFQTYSGNFEKIFKSRS